MSAHAEGGAPSDGRDSAAVGRLFEELAAGLGAGAVKHFPAGGDGQWESWAVAVPNDRVVEIAADASTKSLVFAISFGPFQQQPTIQLLELMLSYNNRAADNGGLHIALDETGAPLLMYRIVIAMLDARLLGNAIMGMAEIHAAWAKLLAQPVLDDTDAALDQLASRPVQMGDFA